MLEIEQKMQETEVKTPSEATPETEKKTEIPLTMDEVKKMIQSENDKVRTEYSKKLKAVESERETLLKEKMTEKEKAEFELKRKMDEIADREKQLNVKDLQLKKMGMLKDNIELLDLSDFITGSNEEELSSNIKKLKKVFSSAVQAATEARLKDAGRGETPPDANKVQKPNMTLREELAEAVFGKK